MTTIAANIHGNLGPYKGYVGSIEYDAEDGAFHGKVLGTNDVITFEADTVRQLFVEFQASVDDYLEFCKSRGEKPEKPFSGKFMARVPPALHKRLSIRAESLGVSLNQFVVNQLSAAVAADDQHDALAGKSTAPPRSSKPLRPRKAPAGKVAHKKQNRRKTA